MHCYHVLVITAMALTCVLIYVCPRPSVYFGHHATDLSKRSVIRRQKVCALDVTLDILPGSTTEESLGGSVLSRRPKGVGTGGGCSPSHAECGKLQHKLNAIYM
jgi:hypothetical protein